MKQIILYAILSLLFLSCGNVKNKVGKNADELLILKFEDQSLSSLFSNRIFGKMEMTPLETDEKCLVGAYPELLADDRHFFITDRQQHVVFRFDRAGKFINQIGKRGRGPGEYSGILDFDVDAEANVVEILVSGGQIMRYNYDGTFVSNQKYDIKYLHSFIKTGADYWFNIGATKFSEDGHLLKVSEDGTVIEKFLPVKTDWEIPFGDRSFSRCGDMISFKEVFSNTVHRITDNGPIETTVIDFGRYAIPKNSYERDLTDVVYELEKKGWAVLYRYYENDQFVYICFRVQQNDKSIGNYHWLVNKKTGNSVLQKVLPDDPLFDMMEEAKILTAENELVFMANAQMLKECTDPFFNTVNISNGTLSESNPIIVSLKINDF